MTAPRDILSAMAAGTPGILAAGVWGLDGTPAELLTFEAGFPVESVIPEITVAAKLFLYLCRKLGEDRLDEFMVSGKGNVGKARVQLRRHLPELAARGGVAQASE